MGEPRDIIGLCVDCGHARIVVGARGARYLLCGEHATAPGLPKYPRLPVLRCAGFTAAGRGAAGRTPVG